MNHTEYMRIWRASKPGYEASAAKRYRSGHQDAIRKSRRTRQASERAQHPEKKAARLSLWRAIKRGDIVRLWCARCLTDEKVQAHHHSYAWEDRFDVTWLCSPCHRWLHARIAEAK
jgi:hypothetical protein